MTPTRQRTLLLHLAGNVIRTTADSPVLIVGKGWLTVADLRAGDRMKTMIGQEFVIERIEDQGESEVVYQLQPTASPHLHTGLLAAGTMIHTADGPKPIEDVKAGDYIAMPRPLDPERNWRPWRARRQESLQ